MINAVVPKTEYEEEVDEIISRVDIKIIRDDARLFKEKKLHLTETELVAYIHLMMGHIQIDLGKFALNNKEAGKRVRSNSKLLEALFLGFRKITT